MTASTFWDKHAPKYAAQPVADPDAYEAMLSRVRGLLQPSDRVLEIGCGTGTTALKLAPSVASMTATDSSVGMIQIARRKVVGGWAPNVSFAIKNAEAPIRGPHFDCVLAFSLLHLIKDLPQLLGSVREQIRPGGLFISKSVCLGDRSMWLRWFVRALTALRIAPHVTMLRREELETLTEAAGFKLLDVRYFDKRKMNPFIVAQRVD